MNHDYAHCLDYTENCPKDCFRAQLQRDIEENRSEFIGLPLTYEHLLGTEECKLVKDKYVTYKMELSCNAKVIEEWQSCKCSVCGRYDTRPYLYYFSEPNFYSWCGANMMERGKNEN